MLTWNGLPWQIMFSLSSSIFLEIESSCFILRGSLFAGCRNYWFFLVLLSGVILNKSNFLFHTWSPWGFFKVSYHIPQVFRLKKKSMSSTGSHMKLFWDFFPLWSLSWVWYNMKKGRLKDDLKGTFKCQGNCYTEEAGKTLAITMETRNHRLIFWLKRFRYQETCLNLMDWDTSMDCHGKLKDLLP